MLAAGGFAARTSALKHREGLLVVLIDAPPIAEQLAGEEAAAAVAARTRQSGRVESCHEEDHRVRRVTGNATPAQVEPPEVIAPRAIVRVTGSPVEAGRKQRIGAISELEEDPRPVAPLRVASLALGDAPDRIAVPARVLFELARVRLRVGVCRERTLPGGTELPAARQEEHNEA